MGVLSYLGILVLIPLLAGDKKSEYVRFHVNQGLVLCIISKITDLLEGSWGTGWRAWPWYNFGGSLFEWIFDIIGLACFILMIVGIVSACKGEEKEFPVIGKIKILK